MKKIKLFLSFLVLSVLATTLTFAQTPDSLFIVGSATPIGWNIDQAIELDKNPENADQFIYDGPLFPGEFKFPVNRQTDWQQDMYMKDPENDSVFYHHLGGEEDDNKWVIAEGEESLYNVVLDFTTMVIKINKIEMPPAPDSLFIVGDATPIGWSIDQAIELTKNPDNSQQFIYDGTLGTGEFKFPVNRQTDWQQDMYMKDTVREGSFYLHIGGDPDDNKWVIAEGEGGTYYVVLDFNTMTIEIDKIIETLAPDSLFIVGSATPIGWSIDQAIELTMDPDDRNIFIYDGILIPGEFKFPVNRQTDWQQDMFMKDTVNEGYFYYHIGGDPDDSKWVIAEGDSGLYHIVLDFVTMTIEITKLGAIPDVLYIIGSATAVGWNIDQAIELTKNPDNPYQFIYHGTLVPGEFKFPVNRQTDWQQDMYMKDTVNEGYFYLHIGGDPDDNKWVIPEGEGGTYHVVLDFSDNTIEFALATSIGAVHSGHSKITVYPNPASNWLNINLGEKNVGSVSIYSLSGKTLHQAQVNSSSTDIDLTKLNISGLVLIKVSTTSNTEIFKCMVE